MKNKSLFAIIIVMFSYASITTSERRDPCPKLGQVVIGENVKITNGILDLSVNNGDVMRLLIDYEFTSELKEYCSKNQDKSFVACIHIDKGYNHTGIVIPCGIIEKINLQELSKNTRRDNIVSAFDHYSCKELLDNTDSQRIHPEVTLQINNRFENLNLLELRKEQLQCGYAGAAIEWSKKYNIEIATSIPKATLHLANQKEQQAIALLNDVGNGYLNSPIGQRLHKSIEQLKTLDEKASDYDQQLQKIIEDLLVTRKLINPTLQKNNTFLTIKNGIIASFACCGLLFLTYLYFIKKPQQSYIMTYLHFSHFLLTTILTASEVVPASLVPVK